MVDIITSSHQNTLKILNLEKKAKDCGPSAVRFEKEKKKKPRKINKNIYYFLNKHLMWQYFRRKHW